MGEITGALIGIAMVLSAVFLPMAFFSGSVGVIYRQFSVTIVSAMVLSVLVAIVLTPALCATMLKSNGHAPNKGLFGLFNRGFDRATSGYARASAASFAVRSASSRSSPSWWSASICSSCACRAPSSPRRTRACS